MTYAYLSYIIEMFGRSMSLYPYHREGMYTIRYNLAQFAG